MAASRSRRKRGLEPADRHSWSHPRTGIDCRMSATTTIHSVMVGILIPKYVFVNIMVSSLVITTRNSERFPSRFVSWYCSGLVLVMSNGRSLVSSWFPRHALTCILVDISAILITSDIMFVQCELLSAVRTIVSNSKSWLIPNVIVMSSSVFYRGHSTAFRTWLLPTLL